jgi:hypothetical protein
VGAFGLTTAANYAQSGLIDWPVAAEFIAGGAVGGLFGIRLAMRLGARQRLLTILFAIVVFLVAIFMGVRTIIQLRG